MCVQSVTVGESTFSNLYANVQKYAVIEATDIISRMDPRNGNGTKHIPSAIPLMIPTTVREYRKNMTVGDKGSRIVRSMIVDINIMNIPAINSANAKTRCTYMFV